MSPLMKAIYLYYLVSEEASDVYKFKNLYNSWEDWADYCPVREFLQTYGTRNNA